MRYLAVFDHITYLSTNCVPTQRSNREVKKYKEMLNLHQASPYKMMEKFHIAW